MKKRFYSLWFRVVSGFFWIMVWSAVLCISIAYGLIRFRIWEPFSHGSFLNALAIMAFVSTLIGTLISLFVAKFAILPITRLSDAIEKVADGDYQVTLDTRYQHGELLQLYENFNQMAQELNGTEFMHRDFISSVSHEFKTPLATISGYATLLQDDTLTPEEHGEYVNTIIQSTRDLSRMATVILDISRLEQQTIIPEKKLFRVDEILRRTILYLEPLWSGKNLSIDPELDEINWYGSQELTTHIWNNLLDNAIKFTPQGGTVRVTAHMDHDWLTVSVIDNGSGMSPEVQKHIFEKFYQGDPSHQKKGSGLGLALVHRIVTLHRGTIFVESAPGKGSAFTVRLPVEAPSSPPSPGQP